jgi:hypothetical protein
VNKVFFQTTPLSNFELAEAIANANRQDDKIMLLLQHRAPEALTAYQIKEHFDRWPITSIRRSLTTLEEKGLIIHDGYVKGELGTNVGKYRVPSLSEVKTDTDDDDLIPEALAARRIGAQILKKWIAEQKIPFTGKRPKKFRQKDLNKAIMLEFMKTDSPQIDPKTSL